MGAQQHENAARAADDAPPGCAWALAKVVTPHGNWRSHLETLPEHGHFANKQDAQQVADRMKTGDTVVVPLLIELPAGTLEEQAAGSAS